MRTGLLFGLLLCLWFAPAFAAAPILFNVGSCLVTTPVSPATSAVATIPPNPQNLLGSFPVNLQTGTSYGIVANDRCKFVKLSNAAAVALTLPGTVLPAGWVVFLEDRGAGGATITPGAGQIESASSYPIAKDQPIAIFSDGSNYHVWGTTTGSGSITINGVTCTLGGSCTISIAFIACSGNNHALQSTVMGGFSCATDITDLDVTGQSVTGGAIMISLANSAGNITVDCGLRPGQYIANTGAFTITAPANDEYCYLDVENGVGAGAVSLFGFSPNTMGGATLDTTNGHNFRLNISRVHGHSSISATALQ